MQLLVQQQDKVFTVSLNYHDGERYPVLQRVDGMPDYLDDITRPRAAVASAAATTAGR